MTADGDTVATSRTFNQAVATASTHDRRRRRIRATLMHLGVILLSAFALFLVIETREVDNPGYPGARELADQMEAAYRLVDDGAADITSFTVEADGFTGGLFEVERSGVTNDYRLLAGSHDGDCYVIRWVRFEVPFVGRLLPRFDCEPGQPALNFSPSAWEAIAVNLTNSGDLEWYPVIPDPVRVAPWFLPGTVVLLMLILQQAVSISILYLRSEPMRKVPVQRIETPI